MERKKTKRSCFSCSLKHLSTFWSNTAKNISNIVSDPRGYCWKTKKNSYFEYPAHLMGSSHYPLQLTKRKCDHSGHHVCNMQTRLSLAARP